MNPTQVVIYARVSSEQEAETHTIASQMAALRERVAADGLTVFEAMQFLDEGYSGATLVRPALERLRVAYPRLADILSGPLPSHLRRLTQRVMSPPNRFSTPRLPRLTCL